MVSASFQSTHPSGVRLALVARFARTFLFQSTHPSGVRPSKRGLLSVANYFNPRTPVGCDRGDDAVRWTGAISIHAPQWGATGIDMPAKTDPVFQSTHPSGVRRSRCSTCFSGRRDFNPRTPVGCDAPILGAVSYADGFQSTHPSGVRHDTGAFCAATYEFQSTHPSGVRPATGGPWRNTRHFNPRTPVGCDETTQQELARQADFNPRTPVGCDNNLMTKNNVLTISIHAPQWGATMMLAI